MSDVVTVVTFEPDWCGVYVNGDLYGDGHDYEKFRITRRAINGSESDIERIETQHLNPDEPWEGTPDTLNKVDEIYG